MDISVCIVNLNSIKYLKRCLESLKKGIRDNSFEVIIVDNNSKDGSISYIENFTKFKIKLIKNKFNSGYTKAMNQALKKVLVNIFWCLTLTLFYKINRLIKS